MDALNCDSLLGYGKHTGFNASSSLTSYGPRTGHIIPEPRSLICVWQGMHLREQEGPPQGKDCHLLPNTQCLQQPPEHTTAAPVRAGAALKRVSPPGYKPV